MLGLRYSRDPHNSSMCYAVTIIVEGGYNTLEVISNDVSAKRPVVIVNGSGRLANFLCKLIESMDKTGVLEYVYVLCSKHHFISELF